MDCGETARKRLVGSCFFEFTDVVRIAKGRSVPTSRVLLFFFVSNYLFVFDQRCDASGLHSTWQSEKNTERTKDDRQYLEAEKGAVCAAGANGGVGTKSGLGFSQIKANVPTQKKIEIKPRSATGESARRSPAEKVKTKASPAPRGGRKKGDAMIEETDIFPFFP